MVRLSPLLLLVPSRLPRSSRAFLKVEVEEKSGRIASRTKMADKPSNPFHTFA